MPISVSCKCGKKFKAPEKLAGKTVKCPACSEPLQIPQVQAAAAPSSSPAPAKAIKVGCSCGKNLMVKAELAGKSIRCPNCGNAVKVTPQSAGQRKSAGPPPKGTLGDMLDEVDLRVSSTGRRCPECRNEVQPDDVLCVKCGYNLETGKKLETKTSRKLNALGQLEGPPSESAKKGQRKKKSSSSDAGDVNVGLVLGILGLLLLPTAALWFVEPVYSLGWFAVTNSIIGLVAYIMVVVVAFRDDGALHGVLTLICGIYWLVYTFTHLETTKQPAIVCGICFVGSIAMNVILPGLLPQP